MKKVEIIEKNNGWVVKYEGFIRVTGEYVYSAVDILKLIEGVGGHLNTKKIKVEER